MSTNNIAQLPKRVDVRRAAEILNKSEKTVYRYARDRRVPSFKIGGSVEFSEEALVRFVLDSERPIAA